MPRYNLGMNKLTWLALSILPVTAACGSSQPAPNLTPQPVAPAQPATSSDTPEVPAVAPVTCKPNSGDAALYKEAVVGGVAVGMPLASLQKAWGEPSARSGPTDNVVAGGRDWNWAYADRNATVGLWSETTADAATVSTIILEAGSAEKTLHGIGIGSSADEVRLVYSPCISPDDSTDTTIVVGSVYGGMFFEIEEGIVKRVFVGAGAE